LCREIETIPLSWARRMMLSENGPENICGNNVKISK